MDKTIKAYNKWAKLYDKEVADFWQNFPQKTIAKFVSCLNGKKVLNLGSGSGRDALILKKAGFEVICFDASQKMIDTTRKLGFKSVKGDFRHLKFKPYSFDGVWAYTSLLHVKKSELKSILKNIHSILKTKGVFFIGMIEGDFNGMLQREGWMGSDRYFRFYKAKELSGLIQKSGFKLIFQSKYKPHSKTYINQLYTKIS